MFLSGGHAFPGSDVQTVHEYHLLQVAFVTVNLILVGFELSTSFFGSQLT